MLVSFKHRCAFLAVPRTASRSIAQWLLDDDPDARYFGGHHGRQLSSKFAHFHTFTVLRHPYTRAVSFWLHAMKDRPRLVNPNDSELFRRCGGPQSFTSFARWLASPRPEDPREWGNQRRFIAGIRIDQRLHFETLREDFAKLPFVPPEGLAVLPKIGEKLGNADWRQYYRDPDAIKYVTKWAERDFEIYSYNKHYHISGSAFCAK